MPIILQFKKLSLVKDLLPQHNITGNLRIVASAVIKPMNVNLLPHMSALTVWILTNHMLLQKCPAL